MFPGGPGVLRKCSGLNNLSEKKEQCVSVLFYFYSRRCRCPDQTSSVAPRAECGSWNGGGRRGGEGGRVWGMDRGRPTAQSPPLWMVNAPAPTLLPIVPVQLQWPFATSLITNMQIQNNKQRAGLSPSLCFICTHKDPVLNEALAGWKLSKSTCFDFFLNCILNRLQQSPNFNKSQRNFHRFSLRSIHWFVRYCDEQTKTKTPVVASHKCHPSH